MAGLRHNLQPQSTTFVGREDEIAEISSSLADIYCRLLTLVGPGGIGKTRLVLAAAEQYLDTITRPSPTTIFPDGIFFVALQPITSAEHIIPTIGSALGFDFSAAIDPKEQLLNYLHEKQLLLILDNFEHLLVGATLVTELLSSGSQAKILVTSRESLKLREEWVFHVKGMRFPENEFVEERENYSAVQLFAERARRVRLDFSLNDERSCVTRICQLVEGMPLGIELAAIWIKRLPCAEIAAEIQRNLDILKTDLHGVPDRHRSMRAVFIHSWGLLDQEERDLFKRLSVFRGGFKRKAAEQVAGATLLTLSALVDKSMLAVTRDSRYQIHELQRQFAAEQLEKTPLMETAVRDRHCEYYTALMNRPMGDFHRPETQKDIEADIDNVRLAWNWAVTHTRITDLHKGVEGIYHFSWLRNWHREGEEALQRAVAALRTAETSVEGKVALGFGLSVQGAMDLWMGRVKLAKERAKESLIILRPLDAKRELAFSLMVLAWGALTERNWESGKERALALEAVSLLEETGQYELQGWG